MQAINWRERVGPESVRRPKIPGKNNPAVQAGLLIVDGQFPVFFSQLR